MNRCRSFSMIAVMGIFSFACNVQASDEQTNSAGSLSCSIGYTWCQQGNPFAGCCPKSTVGGAIERGVGYPIDEIERIL